MHQLVFLLFLCVLACLGCATSEQVTRDWEAGVASAGVGGSAGSAAGSTADTPPTSGSAQQGGSGGQVSGARIIARYNTAVDGSQVFFGWYDTQLEVACTWLKTATGTRCIPSDELCSSLHYADEEKQQRVCARPHTSENVEKLNSVKVQGVYEVYRLTNPYVGQVYFSDGGPARPQVSTTDYWTNVRVSDSDFVLMTEGGQ